MSEQHIEPVNDSFSAVQYIPKTEFESVKYSLPTSKSHMIRLLALAAINQGTTKLRFDGIIGQDIDSMIESLRSLGVNISFSKDNNSKFVTVSGVGSDGFKIHDTTINCGNSGTALRIIMGLIASMDQPVMIIGDESLSSRDNDVMIQSLCDSNVSVERIGENNLPIVIHGPWFDGNSEDRVIAIDSSKSSQPLTSWMIASALFPCNVKLEVVGETVSNRHYQLTKDLCNEFGANINSLEDGFLINKWNVNFPENYFVPGDASMASFAILLTKIHNCQVNLENWPEFNDALGNEMLQKRTASLGISWENNIIRNRNNGKYSSYDLTNCNDLITPLTVILALSNGGEISGISHTVFKESNRIEKTIELMDCFGLKATLSNQKILVEGGQKPKSPESSVNCHNDHRIFMSAAILMTKFGGDLIGKGLHSIADSEFLTRLGIE
ncbi:MAG: hypothetical protein MKZ57_01665 [Candidatus Poseidoniaceae archaeon]|nr:hypothetical protein [Candidatus Poseidoniaceae archaeon]